MASLKGTRINSPVALFVALGCACLLCACSATSSSAQHDKLSVVAAESPWGAIAQAVGGPYVHVQSLIQNPNSDPHEFTANASNAAAVSTASVVIQNGLGYDAFMAQLLSTGATGPRSVITAAQVLNVSGPGANPHLWYAIERVPQMARAMAKAFAQHDPAHVQYFSASATAFDESLAPLIHVIHQIATQKGGTPVGETERIAGYLLQEAALHVVTPIGFALSIESGTSPNASDTVAMNKLLTSHGIDVLLYNQQTVSPTTQAVSNEAAAHHIAIVGVTETVQPIHTSYVAWQRNQVQELARALGVHQ